MKILELVKMNGSHALVVDDIPPMVNYKMSPDTIISTNETFYKFYGKEYDKYAKAFAGRSFELLLDDGSIQLCSGQWWDSVTPTASMLTSHLNLTRVSCNTKSSLMRCYVYYGYAIDSSILAQMTKDYSGKIWEYHEYDKHINFKKYGFNQPPPTTDF